MKRDHTETENVSMVATAEKSVMCCLCALPIAPNPSMMCVDCLSGSVDVTEGICRQVMLPHCGNCNRYLNPPWQHAELESRELLSICLKKIKGLSKVNLVDANFIWTEEHSKRLKVKCTIQKDVVNGAILQQNVVVEFVVQNLQCDECKKSFTPHTWQSQVQVRQAAEHKRTFLWLEQLILKHNAHDKVLFVTERPDGVDFHFGNRSHAQSFANFVSASMVAKSKHSKHLISHDGKSNTYNYKYTILTQLSAISRDDLVWVPKDIAKANGGLPQLLVCHKISTGLHLVDPQSCNGLDMAAYIYWKKPFNPVCSRRHLTEFLVLNVDVLPEHEQNVLAGKHFSAGRNKFKLCDVECARLSDLGQNDEKVIVRSHLGNYLRPGDHVYGYDMRTVNIPEDFDPKNHPDVILVKRSYKRRQQNERKWDLNRMEMAANDKADRQNIDRYTKAADLEDFKNDLEEDPEFRSHVNLYKNPKWNPEAEPTVEESDYEVDDDVPEIAMAELLEGLQLNDPADVPINDDSDEDL